MAVSKHAVAWQNHEAAEKAAKALGVSVGTQVGASWQHVQREARVVLPTEALLSSCAAARTQASRNFHEALENCPAVMSEVFNMLGAGE